jgi:hypothetical protein
MRFSSVSRLLVLSLAIYPAERVLCADLGQVPAPAVVAGYNSRTFGPSLKLGANWYKFNFYGTDPTEIPIQQKAGGVVISGGGNSYNAQLSTARRVNSGWQGVAFGGGGYFEATLSWRGPYKGYDSGGNGWPSWWSNDIERMSDTSGDLYSAEQAPSHNRGIEVDFMEFWSDRNWGSALHSWFGHVHAEHVDAGDRTSLPPDVNVSDPHRYGFLWVPATPHSRGRAQFYFDRIHISAMDVSWSLYDPNGEARSVRGLNAFSILDRRHLVLILGTGTDNPMTVYGVEVWQRSSNANLALPRP